MNPNEYDGRGYGKQNAFGTDLSLLENNLKLTVTERWEQNYKAALFAAELRRAGEAYRRGLREAARGAPRGER